METELFAASHALPWMEWLDPLEAILGVAATVFATMVWGFRSVLRRIRGRKGGDDEGGKAPAPPERWEHAMAWVNKCCQNDGCSKAAALKAYAVVFRDRRVIPNYHQLKYAERQYEDSQSVAAPANA